VRTNPLFFQRKTKIRKTQKNLFFGLEHFTNWILEKIKYILHKLIFIILNTNHNLLIHFSKEKFTKMYDTKDIASETTLMFALWLLGLIKTPTPLKEDDEIQIPSKYKIVEFYEKKKDLPDDVVIHHAKSCCSAKLCVSLPDKDGVYHPFASIDIKPECEICGQGGCLIDICLYSHETGNCVNHIIHYDPRDYAWSSFSFTKTIYNYEEPCHITMSSHAYMFCEDSDFTQVIPVGRKVDVAWIPDSFE
jgi:hypothetical protein